jgi:hypothetical protein
MTNAFARTPSYGVSELEQSAQAAARMLKLMASEQRLLLLRRLLEGEAPA